MNHKGTTLIELLVILVLIGVIASIVFVSVNVTIENSKKKAFILVGETLLDVASFSYYDESSIWSDDKASLLELVEGEYLTLGELDPWGGVYDYDLSYVVIERDQASVLFKLRMVTSVAILGKDQDLGAFTVEDIYFIESSSGSIIDKIKTMFDNDLEEDITLDDNDNLFTVQGDVKSSVTLNTLNGDDVIFIGGSITDYSTVDTGNGNNQVTVSIDISDHSTLLTGSGNDLIEVKNKLYQGSSINSGAGNDTLTIYKSFTNASIDTGDGDDILISGSMLSNVSVSTGAGNDLLTVHAVSNSFDNSSISLGPDDDRLNIYDTMTGTSSIWDGGLGYDTLHLPEVTLANWDDGISLLFIGFEKVILSDAELDF